MTDSSSKELSNSVSASTSLPDETVPAPPLWEVGSAPSMPSVDNGSARDDDSAIGGMSTVSSTTSLRPSIYEHVEENGRTYHRFRSGKYMLPNDEQEQERLDIQHSLFTMTLGGLHLAPIGSSPNNVLDIATGTGLWATEFALQYPSSRVLGTDLSAIQPLYVPPNCRFEIDDAEDEWIFSDRFDFIHGRALLSCFKDPKYVLQQAYNVLEPGGYLEMQDIVFPFQFLGEPPQGSALHKWFNLIEEGTKKLGRPWNNVVNYKTWMEEIGFEAVVEKKYYWPLNRWAKGEYYKEISRWAQADLLGGLEGMSFKVMGSMGWEAERVREFVKEVVEDVKDTNVHCFAPMRVVYGRKAGGQSSQV